MLFSLRISDAQALLLKVLLVWGVLPLSCLELPQAPEPWNQIGAFAPPSQWAKNRGRQVQLQGPLTLVDNTQWGTTGELVVSWQGRRLSGESKPNSLIRLQRLSRDKATLLAPPRLGSTLKRLRGTVVFRNQHWALQLFAALDWTRAHRPAVPTPEPENLRVAAFNVQNYFLTLNERGANSVEEQRRQTERLAATLALLKADIWGLVELQSGGAALDSLRDAANAYLGEVVYESLVLAACPQADAIEAGLLYRADRVQPLGPAHWLQSKALRRCPLIADFQIGGQSWTLAVVHLKSQRCPRSFASESKSCGEQERLAEAEALGQWVVSERRAKPDKELLLLGDFNSPREEPALARLRAVGLVELLRSEPQTATQPLYSFSYRGKVSLLDGLWGTAGLARSQRGSGVWHINADEPPHLKLHENLVSPAPPRGERIVALQELGPWRSSDHDPVWVSFGR